MFHVFTLIINTQVVVLRKQVDEEIISIYVEANCWHNCIIYKVF